MQPLSMPSVGKSGVSLIPWGYQWKWARWVKYNRRKRNLPKIHWLDAVCVGQSTSKELKLGNRRPLLIIAAGRGNTRFATPTSRGEYNARRLIVRGNMDSKQAILPEFQCPKKYIGNYLSRIASVRKTVVSTIRRNGQVFGGNYKYCQIGHRFDGCDYV